MFILIGVAVLFCFVLLAFIAALAEFVNRHYVHSPRATAPVYTAPRRDDTWTGSRTMDMIAISAMTNRVMDALKPAPHAPSQCTESTPSAPAPQESKQYVPFPAKPSPHSPPTTSTSVTSKSYASSTRR